MKNHLFVKKIFVGQGQGTPIFHRPNFQPFHRSNFHPLLGQNLSQNWNEPFHSSIFLPLIGENFHPYLEQNLWYAPTFCEFVTILILQCYIWPYQPYILSYIILWKSIDLPLLHINLNYFTCFKFKLQSMI